MDQKNTSTFDFLKQLSSEGAVAVLRVLIKAHPKLRGKIEKLADAEMSFPESSEDISDVVFLAVTGLDSFRSSLGSVVRSRERRNL